jgi:2-isopropylmalate synthase
MTNEMKKIQIFDTTLRDGEQSPGAAIDPERKIVIARQLGKLGIDVIEPGFAVSSPGEFAAIQQISRELQHVEIAGFARAVKLDIDAAIKATQDAARRRLHLFISSSDIHLNHQLRKSRDEVVQIARDMVAYGKQFVDEIEFSAMDSTRSGRDFVIQLVEAVIAEGATIINLPDTLGYAMPNEMGELFRYVRGHARGGDSVRYSAHCHNDLGLAVANSLAAIQAGATQIEVTVNGIGERAGNCSEKFMKRRVWSAGRCISRLLTTSRSLAATPSSMNRASIRTACSKIAAPMKLWTPRQWAFRAI